MKLTNLEKETVILFNEAEGVAQVETFNRRLLKQLEKADNASDEVVCEKNTNGYGVYIVPKTMVKIYAPQKLSEEERAKRSEKMRERRAEQLRRSNCTLKINSAVE